MSESPEPAADHEVRHLPVAPDGEPDAEVVTATPAGLPAPAIAAAGGFVLGVAAFLVVRILRGVSLLGRHRRSKPLTIAGTKSFLVDVHLLKR